MPPVPNLSMVKRFWIMLQFWKRDPGHRPAKRANKRSAVPFDLDSIEETMNRRMRMIWVRYATFLSIFGFIVLAGLVVLTVYLTTKATVMKMAVGPKGSKDVEFVDKLAEKFRSERAPNSHPTGRYAGRGGAVGYPRQGAVRSRGRAR